MTFLKKLSLSSFILLFITTLTACSPEMGSDQWCTNMKDKPKSEWAVNEVGNFTKHCLL
ncbi:MAG: hypothetical protein COB23_01075 [Methylophaga sp.]|nr:MAG: hypothetical protein COB23_01075 [Methylophaga sp.]